MNKERLLFIERNGTTTEQSLAREALGMREALKQILLYTEDNFTAELAIHALRRYGAIDG